MNPNWEFKPDDSTKKLVDAVVDGVATEDQLLELTEILEASEDAREYYLTAMAVHGSIMWAHGGFSDHAKDDILRKAIIAADIGVEGGKDSLASTPLRRQSYLSRAFLHENLVGFAAAVLVLTGVILWSATTYIKVARDGSSETTPVDTDKKEHVAWLTGTLDAKWSEGKQPEMVLNRLKAGTKLAIDAGLVELEYVTGAKVIIEGPADFVVGVRNQESGVESGEENVASGSWNSNSGFLKSGALVARCDSPASKGFIIRTSHAQFADVGTEFGVRITNGERVKLQVFEGKVRVNSRSDAGESTVVVAGGGLIADARGMTPISLPDALALSRPFIRKLRPRVPSGMVYSPDQQVVIGKFAKADPPEVRDGDLGTFAVVSGSSVSGKQGSAFLNNGLLGAARNAAVLLTEDSSVTYTFDTIANPSGYDISKIATYAGWTTSAEGRSNQGYEIELTYVDGSTATLVGPETYVSNKEPSRFWTAVIHTNPTGGILENDDGVRASGVKAITWKNFATANARSGPVVYREFDVVGVKSEFVPVESDNPSENIDPSVPSASEREDVTENLRDP